MESGSTMRLLLAGAAVVAVAGGSGAVEPLRLDTALARARAQHPSLRAAAAEVDAARGRLMQAGVIQANPVLSGDAARHTAPPEDNIDRGISLGQEVEVGGQGGLRIAA